jgi:hypothetical protein
MKLVPAIKHIPAKVRLTSDVQCQALVTTISFLNDYPSNFLNAFFMRPVFNAPPFFMVPVLRSPVFFERVNDEI